MGIESTIFAFTQKHKFQIIESVKIIKILFVLEASRGAGAQSVTVKLTGCGFDPHSRRSNICLQLFALVLRQSTALSSTTQNAMPLELGGKWGTDYFNTRFSLLTPLCAGYSVKLI